MVVRPYTPEDYPLAASWWTDRGWGVIPEKFLSDIGLVAEQDGVPSAMIWLYPTNTSVLIAEWLISDPEASPLIRGKAVSALISKLDSVTKASGSFLMTFLQHPGLVRMFEKRGFTAEEKPYTVLYKVGEE
jgi:hypothetical protein